MKSRKSRNLANELMAQLEKFNEIKRLTELAEQEEKDILAGAEIEINTIIEDHDIFCGIVLSAKDLAEIVKLAIETGEKVRIPYKLYYNSDIKEEEKERKIE